ncbi:MAG: HAMP domain-containing protein [Actinobacteria bacterium]|nr:MAG: HAMP domain-containing protein [Actinomycetota bacterium]
MSRWPIRMRVTGAFAVAMAAVLAGSGWFLYARLSSHLDTALRHELQVRAQDLAALVHQPGASLAGDAGGRLVERGESYAELLDLRGRVLEATSPLGRDAVLSPAQVRTASRGPTFADLPQVPGLDEPSRVLAIPVRRENRPLVLVVGATKQDRAETLASFRDELLIAGPIALVLASVIGYLLAGLSLRQVESMRRRAAAISAATPGERLPVPSTGDELERLGTTLNEMLARLEGALERERDFVADAGHELRTPLALLRTELELALRHARSPDELRAAVRASSAEVERLAQLADDLLLIARSDRGKLALKLETIDADDLFRSVATRFQWRVEEEGRDLTHEEGSAARIRGDRLRLEQALANLIDNALRHGDGCVRLDAVTANGHVELHVQDDGRGFPPRFLDDAFERFARPQARRSGEGSGLGLSIARAIAEAHGGTANAANRAGGGADVWLALPLVT